MGYRSDALDKYQITSEAQMANVSKVITGKHIDKSEIFEKLKQNVESEVGVTKIEEKEQKVEMKHDIPIVSTVTINGVSGCSCMKKYNGNNANLVDMTEAIMKGKGPRGKAKIKLEIEITDM